YPRDSLPLPTYKSVMYHLQKSRSLLLFNSIPDLHPIVLPRVAQKHGIRELSARRYFTAFENKIWYLGKTMRG
ncbi:MAG: hypothetical protein ACREUI_09290, partial [Burkholderiales bacterium]